MEPNEEKQDAKSRPGDFDIENVVRFSQNTDRVLSQPKEKPLNFMALVFSLFFFVACVLLALVPFVEEVTLLDATCFFIIGACILALYRQMEDSQLGNERYITYCKLLQEIRDSVRKIGR